VLRPWRPVLLPLDEESIKYFLRAGGRQAYFLRRDTRQTDEELEQAIWLHGLEAQSEAGRPFDIRNPEDRTEIIRRIKRAAARTRRGNPRTVSYDIQRDEDDASEPSWIEGIGANEAPDPIQLIIEEQDSAERQARIMRICSESYSQFSAYLILMFSLDFATSAVSAHLAIAPATLVRRVKGASLWAARQPSLFDRLVALTLDFVPPQRPAYVRRQFPPSARQARQAALNLT
jgi:hypothetical protein